MTWTQERANKRIQGYIASTPKVIQENFNEYHTRFLIEQEDFQRKGLPTKKPLVDIPTTHAIIVDVVHIYATLLNYDDYRIEQGKETENSHAKALNFLHLHYQACDRVIEKHGGQRVDFHSSRVHFVVTEPIGEENHGQRISKALNIATEMQALSKLANDSIAEGKYNAQFRVGIDTGVCVAINGGKARDNEPLFLGSPANHAAKLAAGTEDGIFISNNVRHVLGIQYNMQYKDSFDFERTELLTENTIRTNYQKEFIPKTQEILSEWQDDIKSSINNTGGASKFQFHYHEPPLKDVVYKDLSPSNSIRIKLISIFADIDGYTAYIDEAVDNGDIHNAIQALHVIRSELESVLQDDFKGRKVRFIGDCIHGLVAEGNATDIDTKKTINTAVECVGAMRSSFNTCQEILKTIPDLGLAIGFELGITPISRVGIRGERSVRLATSSATISSEIVQQECDGNQTGIGEYAYDCSSTKIQEFFKGNLVNDFDYTDVTYVVQDEVPLISSPNIARAHSCNKR